MNPRASEERQDIPSEEIAFGLKTETLSQPVGTIPRSEFRAGGYAAISIDKWLWASAADDDVIATVFGQIAQHGAMTIADVRDFLGQRFITSGEHSIRV